MNQKILVLVGAALCCLFTTVNRAVAQGTAFTYQGRLNDSGGPASGSYDLRFKLFVDPLGNTQAGSTVLTNGVSVASGLFMVTVDFGAGVFNGSNYWLEVDVKTNGAGAYVNLTPLQAVTPAPYAVFAENAGNGGLAAGTYTNAVTLNNAANYFSGNFAGDGAGVSNVNALTLDGYGAGGFWQLGGNNVAGGQFIGSTNNQAVEIWAGGARALRFEPNTNGAPNVIGGAPVNFVDSGIVGATIAGGGTVSGNFYLGGGPNHVSAIFGTIAGGRVNTVAADHAFIGGGISNTVQAIAYDSVIGGGVANIIQTSAAESVLGGGTFNSIKPYASYSFLGGGTGNSIQTNAYVSVLAGGSGNSIQPSAGYSFLGGGSGNSIQPSASYSFLGGGVANSIQTNALYSFIGGGYHNTVQTNATYAIIGGGFGNLNGGSYAVVAGGDGNVNTGNLAAVGGGFLNRNSAQFGTVGGGSANTNSGYAATIAGGQDNLNSGYAATIGGGQNNSAINQSATIGGGQGNLSGGFVATVGGGNLNRALADYATVGGGYTNTASGFGATVPGRSGNIAAGYDSFAAGTGAQAANYGSFVWADGTSGIFSSTADNQFAVRAGGGVLLAGDIQIGTGSGDYHHVGLGGGNSEGFLYGSFVKYADGIHLGYNYYADALGGNHIINPGGGTSRITVGYGSIVLATGDVGVQPNFENVQINPTTVQVNGTFNNNSDRNAKQDFAPVSPAEILDKVVQLPVSEWSYKIDPATRHVGPVAQDFHAAFHVGTDDTHIAPMDEGGVALAAIQGLNQKQEEDRAVLKAKEAEIEELTAQNRALGKRLSDLERLVSSLAGKAP